MKVSKWFSSHKTQVATGGGIALLLGTNVLTAIATLRSIRKNDAVEEELGRKTTKKEKLKITWKYWIAPLTTAGAGTASIIWSDKKQVKLTSAALTACSIEKKNLEEYKEIVAKKLDKKTQNEIKDEWNERKVEEIDFKPRKYDIGVPEGDQVYCYDPLFGVKFIASQNDIQAGLNEFNKGMVQYLSKGSVDDLYDHWDVPQHERPDIVKDLGWAEGVTVDVNMNDALVIDNIPRLVIEYVQEPTQI